MMKRFVVLVAVALTVTACSGGDPAVLDWDLSESHTIEDIGGRRGGGGHDSVESVRIALPDGSVFEATEDVNRIAYFDYPNEDDLQQISISFEPQTAEDTYARALALIDEWELTLHPRVDMWWAQAKGVTGPEAAEVDTASIFAARPGTIEETRLGPNGPFIELHILYSFNDERPFFVNFALNW